MMPTAIAWLLARPWVRWAAGGVLAVAVFIALLFVAGRLLTTTATRAGAQTERAATAEATIKNVRKADEAAETIRHDADLRREQCLRYSDSPAYC